MLFTQLLLNGIIAGAMYALIASGFALIYATNRFVHFAHGSVVAATAYMLFFLFRGQSFPFFIACVFAILFGGLLGALLYTGMYLPLKRKNASNAILLIASLGLMIFIENTLLLVYGAGTKTMGFITVTKGVTIFGAVITKLQITMVAAAAALLVLLYLFVRYTRFGKMIRAVSDNPTLAKTTGIHTQRVQLWGFVIGSMMAGVAGILIGLEQNLEPSMGTHLIVKGFTGAVIGGVTSLPGSVLGSMLLGLVENFGIWYIDSGYKDAIAFGLLLVFLLFRPQGILGIFKGTRE